MQSNGYNSGGWAISTLKSTGAEEALAKLPTAVQEAVTRCGAKKKYGFGGQNNTTVMEDVCTLFPLAEVEIFGSAQYSLTGEGTQYEYYKNGGSKGKKLNGANATQWTRSACTWNGTAFVYVAGNGVSGFGAGTGANAVAWAFCF